MPRFDRSYLAPAALEFVVVADTHHIVDPTMYRTEGDSVTPDLVRDWAARGDAALAWARDLGPLLTFHLGDLQQEFPGHHTFDVGRRAAIAQMERAGFAMQHVAGNMDIGDKPDPTMPAGWLREEYLAVWHEDFGRSFRSLDEGDFHFVVLNSQLLNGDLPERAAQRHWLEADLAASAGRRICLFLHVPPFLTDEHEPGLGSYDVIDEPDRGWLLELVRRHRVEAVFCGHTHFRFMSRVGEARLHIAPSTTTTRPGFYEAISVLPPERGWADTAKLGFLLVRARDDGLSVHVVRTSGRTAAEDPDDEGAVVLTRTSGDLPRSPLGTYLRLPIARHSDGALVYPYHVRHRVRDDHPLLACLELGVRHVRAPIQDLSDAVQRERLALMRDEGLALTATVISDGVREAVGDLPAGIDVLEIQTAGAVVPRERELTAIARLSPRMLVGLAPIVLEAVGKVHGRSRTGYRAEELAGVDAALTERGLRVERAVCFVDPGSPTWAQVLAFARLELRAVGGLDLVVPVGRGDLADQARLAEALLAAATMPAARLFVDPLQDLDREAAVMGGLLDRMSNPKPAFHVVRVLNSVLFADVPTDGYRSLELSTRGEGTLVGVYGGGREHWLVTPDLAGAASDLLADRAVAGGAGPAPLRWLDLAAGRSRDDVVVGSVAGLARAAGGTVGLLTLSVAGAGVGSRTLAGRVAR